MSRILYVVAANAQIAGGQKMAIRRVEALNALGFRAACLMDVGVPAPRWFDHQAPIERADAVRGDDVLICPEDAAAALRYAAGSPAARVIVDCQNPYYLAAGAGLPLIAERPDRFATVLTVAPGQAALMRRLFPWAEVEVVRCFADEHLFRPGAKQPLGAYAPRKRPLEAAAILGLHRQLHPDHPLEWIRIENASERQMAEALARASVYLSLSRLESVGMTTLEAMASGCVCAGFTGVGGAEYATSENGFWAPDDDCVAAADAVAEACALVREGGPRLERCLDAARETARQWSRRVFLAELEAVFTRLAPQARR